MIKLFALAGWIRYGGRAHMADHYVYKDKYYTKTGNSIIPDTEIII